ncbi:DUF3617 domain-containing protein [Sphingopyxis flava]|uniref:DUF3617 domain-containing protein n=1 Tax=Sphingopyxis flava TaxID=1507287 RepID=A0A1T5EM02_9SPHN|nr:DUF3617 domain-containing protein [Sphingopyxis flava]SKB85013.1 Protein of unknown function [Sphingopyxis flava]
MSKCVTMAALGAALALAGCGKSDEAGKAGDAADAAQAEGGATAGLARREPGNWKTDVKLVKLDMPGAPGAVKDQMAKQFASAGSTETCLTQAEADQENLANVMSERFGEACTWSKNEMRGSAIDVAGTCTANGQKVELAMAGTVTPDKTDVTITTKTAAPTGGPVEMQMQVTNTRIGPCKA